MLYDLDFHTYKVYLIDFKNLNLEKNTYKNMSKALAKKLDSF